jgi:hypothetical protein
MPVRTRSQAELKMPTVLPTSSPRAIPRTTGSVAHSLAGTQGKVSPALAKANSGTIPKATYGARRDSTRCSGDWVSSESRRSSRSVWSLASYSSGLTVSSSLRATTSFTSWVATSG